MRTSVNILRTRASFLFFTLLGVSAAFLGSDGAAGETDLFWHLRLGLDSLDSGELVSTIGYNWTRAGAPYAQNDWLAEVIFALFFRLGGFRALALLTSVLAGVTTLLTFRASSSFPPAQTALAETPSSIRATAIAAASALLLSVPTMTTRPWLFGYVCAASLVWLMRRADARQPGDAGKYPRLVSQQLAWSTGLEPATSDVTGEAGASINDFARLVSEIERRGPTRDDRERRLPTGRYDTRSAQA